MIVTLVRTHSACDTYTRVLHVCRTCPLPQIVVMFLSSMHSPTVRKMAELSNLMAYLAWHTEDTSITENLTEAAWITHVQAQGLDKLHQPTTLTFVKDTVPDIRQCSSILGGLTNSSPFACQDYCPRYQTDSLNAGQSTLTLEHLFHLQTDSELRELMYCPRPTNPTWHLQTCVTLHVSPTTGAQAPQ